MSQPEPHFSTTRMLLPRENASFTADEPRQALASIKNKGGLYFHGLAKRSQPDLPLVTIITAQRNGGAGLEETIQCVLNQDYPNIEYIIIDGNSSQETLEIIRKYESGIDLWISEPDSGFYDAVNKAIPLAAGELINVLNADDLFLDRRAISHFVRAFQETGADLIYSDTLIFDKKRGYGHIRYAQLTRFHLANGGISQQSIFVRKSVFDRVGLFNLSFPISADYEFLIRAIFREKVRKFYLNAPLILFSQGGASVNSERERMEILRLHYKPWQIKLFRSRLFRKCFKDTDLYFTIGPLEWMVRKVFHLWS